MVSRPFAHVCDCSQGTTGFLTSTMHPCIWCQSATAVGYWVQTRSSSCNECHQVWSRSSASAALIHRRCCAMHWSATRVEDVCAQESLRPIKLELPDAVSTCIDAALCEQPPHSSNLLRAASFGRHFLSDTLEPDRHREACKNLRICVGAAKVPSRDSHLPRPQLEKLGIAGRDSENLFRRRFLLLLKYYYTY